jgi:hypothetical protein
LNQGSCFLTFFFIFCSSVPPHLSFNPLSPLNLLTPSQSCSAAPRYSSHLAAQRSATPPHPPNSLAARHPHPPNHLRPLLPAGPPCPRHRRQELPLGACPRHSERLELSAPVTATMVLSVDLGPPYPRRRRQELPLGACPHYPKRLELSAPVTATMLPSVDLGCQQPFAPMRQSQATTQARAEIGAGGGLLHGVRVLPLWSSLQRCKREEMVLTFMELQLPLATFWKTSRSCGRQQRPRPPAARDHSVQPPSATSQTCSC